MSGAEEDEYVDSYEDVSIFTLSNEREEHLLDEQIECTFMWSTKDGDPVGVIMNYLWRDGRFWITCTRRRKRVPAVMARPRVAVCISSRGTSIGSSQTVTYKGNATVRDDDQVKSWFYPALAAKVRPFDESAQVAFAEHLDTPGRVIIEIAPDTRIGFDSEQMFKNSPAAGRRPGE
ncbi:MAG: pyridoxamine 5'-phosphate oxidase family protein [Actinomycetota bacterium]